MSNSDQTTLVRRLLRLLPPWFLRPDPVLNFILSGIAAVFSNVYALIVFVRLQTRISTAVGLFLDIISLDYFGRYLVRRANELDAPFATRIKKEIIRERGTRLGMIQAIKDLTGKAPLIFEQFRPADAGGWDNPSFAYDMAGGWGDTRLPAQAFMTVYRPGYSGVPSVAGYDAGPGGYDIGSIEYVEPYMTAGVVTDADIYRTIENTKPNGVIVWVQLI